VEWLLCADVSGQPVGQILSGEEVQEDLLALEDGTDWLSRNVGTENHFTLRNIPEECRSYHKHK
jgi:hypothetical protein